MSLIFTALKDTVKDYHVSFSFEAQKFLLEGFKTFFQFYDRIHNDFIDFCEANDIEINLSMRKIRLTYLENPMIDEFQYDINLVCDVSDIRTFQDKLPFLLYKCMEWFMIQMVDKDQEIDIEFLLEHLRQHKKLFYMFVGVKYDQTSNYLCTTYKQKELLQIANNTFLLKMPKSSNKDRLCDQIRAYIARNK